MAETNYQLVISERNNLQITKSSNSIIGSGFTCSPEHFYTSDSIIFEFRAYNASTDDEWFKDIYIDFPEGIIVDTMTHFVGGTEGEMEHDSTTGNGVIIHWHGENEDEWGVVKGGQTAVARVYTYIEKEINPDAIISFEIHGDIYGSEPHVIIGKLYPVILGEKVNWINITHESGTIETQQNKEIGFVMDSEDLVDSSYLCNIYALDNFGNQNIIPVKLIVDTELVVPDIHIGNKIFVRLYPNPANGILNISCEVYMPGNVSISVFDILGRKTKTLISDRFLHNGRHLFTWDRKDNEGNDCPEGIYYIIIKKGENQLNAKVILN